MNTWNTPYRVVRSVMMEFVAGLLFRHYRLFELEQSVVAIDADGNVRSLTQRTVHCEQRGTQLSDRMVSLTGGLKGRQVSAKYDEMVAEKLDDDYHFAATDLVPNAIPSLARRGFQPDKFSSGRTHDDYIALAEAYLASLDTAGRLALLEARDTLVAALQLSRDNGEYAMAWPVCALLFAERALNAQYYVEHVIAELASTNSLDELAQAPEGIRQLLEAPGCSIEYRRALACLQDRAVAVLA